MVNPAKPPYVDNEDFITDFDNVPGPEFYPGAGGYFHGRSEGQHAGSRSSGQTSGRRSIGGRSVPGAARRRPNRPSSRCGS